MGLVLAADLSCRMGQLERSVLQRLLALLKRAGLPVEAPRIGTEQVLEYMRIDKKVKSGRVRLVLLKGLGAAELTAEYSDQALAQTLSAHFGREAPWAAAAPAPAS